MEIFSVTTNTFQINVGSSSYTGTHTYVGGTSSNAIERQTGTITVNVGGAGAAAGNPHIL